MEYSTTSFHSRWEVHWHGQSRRFGYRDGVRAIVGGEIGAGAVVAAGAEAAEGQTAAGAGGRAVPVNYTGAAGVGERLPLRWLITEQPGTEAELRVVGQCDCIGKIFGAEDLEQRAED